MEVGDGSTTENDEITTDVAEVCFKDDPVTEEGNTIDVKVDPKFVLILITPDGCKVAEWLKTAEVKIAVVVAAFIPKGWAFVR